MNLWWGMALLCFGLVMLWLARSAAKKKETRITVPKDAG
jgi:hypothetical protein